MPTTFDYTFDGKVTWDIVSQSWDTDTAALKLETAIKEAAEIPANEASYLGELCVMLSCTKDVTFTANGVKPSPIWLRFQDLLKGSVQPADLWNTRKQLPNTLVDAWKAAFLAAQDLFVIDPAQLPDDRLTDDQREALKDVNSPLAGVVLSSINP
jgi:hypothetical protein